MVRSTRALVGGMMLGIWVAAAQTSPTDEDSAPASTLQRAALYLDRSSTQFDRLLVAIHNGTAADVDEAFKQYTREFSQFHVTMAKLRIGKQELGFAVGVVDELNSQISRLEALHQNLKPSRAVAFGEALSHLKSALQMITQEVDSKSRSRLVHVQGAGPSTPGTRLSRWEPRP